MDRILPRYLDSENAVRPRVIIVGFIAILAAGLTGLLTTTQAGAMTFVFVNFASYFHLWCAWRWRRGHAPSCGNLKFATNGAARVLPRQVLPHWLFWCGGAGHGDLHQLLVELERRGVDGVARQRVALLPVWPRASDQALGSHGF